MKRVILFLFGLSSFLGLAAQSVAYPHEVRYFSVPVEGKQYQMAYMDVPSKQPNGRSVVLFHGKNFNGFYWKDVIAFLNDAGYRVIVPDQLGFGRSDKPNIHYSFHMLASNTKLLLDSLQISKVDVIAHSMGGMLATRFCLLFPAQVNRLIFENPIGLEDYKRFVPYRPLDSVFISEARTSYESLKKYQKSYYPQWKPEYEPLVAAQWASYSVPDFQSASWASALTYQMIYEQPVVYEFDSLHLPVLILIGQEDRTIVGKNLLSPSVAADHGQYPALGRQLQAKIRRSKLVPLAGVGHIPHIQVPARFKSEVLKFLNER